MPAMAAWPMSLSVEPTTSCNLRCPECPSGLRSFTRPTGMLNPERLSDLLSGPEGMARDLVYLNLYFQGEPYLNPGMDELVATGKREGLYVSTSTNAHHINPERAERIVNSGIDRLIISIDGADQASYASYRVGGQLQKVLEATRHILDARKRLRGRNPHVVWQFLVVGPNEHQLPTMKSMARQWGVDEFVVKTAQLDAPRDGHPLLTQDPRLRRYDRDPSGRWTLRNPMHDRCWRMWQGAVVTWDGQVVPCCFDKDAQHSMGRATDGAAFREIWQSPRYQQFRSSVFAHRAGIEMCRNCSEGTEVWA
jgi:radical SAM protein with 4Fe4S-binding SPASM domain